MPTRVWWRLEDTPPDFGPAALTIGKFDGVHMGHRALMRRAKELGSLNGWKPSVLTFYPHPAKIVAPSRAPRMITPFERRAELMGSEGIEQVLMLPFTLAVSQWSPREFVEDLLVRRLGARCVIVGDDFRFGHKQAGDLAMLRDLGERLGFTVDVVPPVDLRGVRVSSSFVRDLVNSGRIARANRALRKPFELQGRVVAGHGVGSKQTVPTLNLHPDSEVLPMKGVYATRTTDPASGRKWDSISNVGTRPTFDGASISVETFLLSPFDGVALERIRVEFLWRLRDERKFESAELLKAQILRDVAHARRVHRRLGPWVA